MCETQNNQIFYKMVSTINEAEVKKFSDIANEWWSETGKFKPLHKFNPIRISYIRNKIIEHFFTNNPYQKSFDTNSATPFCGLKIIDIGCGGGLISEPFARMGADVTGIDASTKNIEVAKIHAQKSDLKINYRAVSAEELIAESLENKDVADFIKNGLSKKVMDEKKFDVVFALEIIEHVADVAEFVRSCSALLKDDGILFIATMNRTVKSMLFAKIGAEYILRWLPIGTHSWQKFLKPSEINSYAQACNLDLQELTGFSYNLLKDEWKINKNDLDVNYAICFKKRDKMHFCQN